MEIFIIGTDSQQDVYTLFFRWLIDPDLLKTAHHGTTLLKMLLILIISSCSDKAKLPPGQIRF